MKRWFLAIILMLSLGLPAQVVAQDSIRVLDQNVETAFREYITFNIAVESDSPIIEAQLLYIVSGRKATARGDAKIEPGTQVEASFTIDQERDYLPPGTELDYWWKITDEAGNELKTERQPLVFLDDRHDWQELSGDRLSLYWYRGDQAFGKDLFDTANAALDRLESKAGAKVERPVKVFIYGSFSDLRDAIAVGGNEWTGGQAFVDQGVVVIGISPSNLRDFGRFATPHEVTHLVIHQITNNSYGDIPRWLDEGLAVYMSGELDADSRRYRAEVTNSAQADKLMTLQTLSSSFPADSAQASLAYAQSGAVVEFIIQHYGEDAMAELLNIFSEGALYDDALEQAMDVDTWELDNVWRESIGAPSLEIPAAASGETSRVTEEPIPATEEPAPAAEEPVPAPTEASAPEEPSTPAGGGLALPCLGSSLTGLAVLGLFVLFRARGSTAA
jgi:hypothetical protein